MAFPPWRTKTFIDSLMGLQNKSRLIKKGECKGALTNEPLYTIVISPPLLSKDSFTHNFIDINGMLNNNTNSNNNSNNRDYSYIMFRHG